MCKQQVFVTVFRKTSAVNDKVIHKYHSVNAQNYVRTINANMIRLEDANICDRITQTIIGHLHKVQFNIHFFVDFIARFHLLFTLFQFLR